MINLTRSLFGAFHYQSTRFRFCFVSLRLFLNSLFRALAALDIPFRCLRTFGRGQAARTIFCSFPTADFRFIPWVRCSCDVIVNMPSFEVLLDCCSLSRRCTSAGIHFCLDERSSRNSTLVLSLLTFCPPDPEDRTKLISRLSSGILISFGTVHVGLWFAGFLGVFFLGSYGTYSHVGTMSPFSLPLSDIAGNVFRPKYRFRTF